MTDLINWTPDMSVGVSVLDEDHRRIMILINRLHDSIQNGEGTALMGDILQALHVYILLHFDSEELMLRQTNYPDTDGQHQAHEKMKEKTSALLNVFRESPESVRPVEVLMFLRDWWVDHIMNSDMKYAAHLRSFGFH